MRNPHIWGWIGRGRWSGEGKGGEGGRVCQGEYIGKMFSCKTLTLTFKQLLVALYLTVSVGISKNWILL